MPVGILLLSHAFLSADTGSVGGSRSDIRKEFAQINHNLDHGRWLAYQNNVSSQLSGK